MTVVNDALNTLIEAALRSKSEEDLSALEARNYDEIADPSLLRSVSLYTHNLSLKEDLSALEARNYDKNAYPSAQVSTCVYVCAYIHIYS